MNTVCKQFLACTGLSDNQYIRVHPAVAFCHLDIFPNCPAMSKNILKCIFGCQAFFRKSFTDLPLFFYNPVSTSDEDQCAGLQFFLIQRFVLYIIIFSFDSENFFLLRIIFKKIFPFYCRHQWFCRLSDYFSYRRQLEHSVCLIVDVHNLSLPVDSKDTFLTVIQHNTDNIRAGTLKINRSRCIECLNHGNLYSIMFCMDMDTL